MLKFRKIGLEDIDFIRKVYKGINNRMTDDTPGSIIMWRDYFDTEVAEFEDAVIFKTNYPKVNEAFVMPVGNVKKGIEKIIEYCAEKGTVPKICAVNSADLSFLENNFKVCDKFQTREWFEYIYDAEKMKTFGGKKLSGQRNHKNNFIKNYPNWHFEEITENNIDKAKAFFNEFSNAVNKDSELFKVESNIVCEVLENYKEYGMLGGMIIADEKVFGMAMGEIIGDTVFIHIEKARRDVNGAYQMIASEFVNHFCSDEVKFVNREDDGGDEGLRISKLSYHPSMLLEKYVVTL